MLSYISQYSAFLPVAVFLAFFRKIKEWHIWIIAFYCIYCFGNDWLMTYRFKHGLRIGAFFYIFTIIEYSIFAIFLWSIFSNKLLKRILLILSIVFIAFCLEVLVLHTIKKFDSVQVSTEAIIILGFCIAYLFEQVNKPQITFLYSNYKFWFVVSMLIYLSATFFLFILAANTPANVIQQYWIISDIGNILKNILFALAVIIYVKTPKESKMQYPKNHLHILN